MLISSNLLYLAASNYSSRLFEELKLSVNYSKIDEIVITGKEGGWVLVC